MPVDTQFMEKLVALCKRRGFIFPSSEIYGGINGFWDYGPLGAELKRNIKNAWWQDMIVDPPAGPDGKQVEMVGLDCSIIMNPRVWDASGHTAGFADPMVECSVCRKRFRADQVEEMLDSSEWLRTLRAAWKEAEPASIRRNLERWIQKQGKAAPGLALVRDTAAVLERIQNAITQEIQAHGGQLRENFAAWFGFVVDGGGQRSVSEACPSCGGPLGEARQFNLMFKTYVGALEDASAVAYLRPETAQGIFVNFRNVLDTSRVKIPFGIGQTGKAFRNEVNPRNYTFRSREFEQMEIEFFCRGGEDSAVSDLQWYEFWRNTRYQWYVRHGLRSDKLLLRDQTSEELAHYSKACADIEYLFPFSDEHQELEGVAHRGTFDLTQHQTYSGKDMSYFDDDGWQRFMREHKESGKPEMSKDEKAKASERFRFMPTVIEPSAGADRATLAFLCEAYTEDQAPNDKGQMETRVVMRFHPRLAPIKAAFLPLVNKEGMPQLAEKLFREARRSMNVFFDDGGAIGRRYRRQDEAGTPFCVTVDGESVRAESTPTVTIRDRDSLRQERVPVEHVVSWLKERVEARP